ncbi:MAG: hypothetical protein ACM32E_20160 [Gemmatimonadota bacterium]
MLVAALVCPHPPLLLPGLSGATDLAAELRAACLDGIRALAAAAPEALVLVGAAEHTGPWDGNLPRGAGRFSAGRVPDGPPGGPSGNGGPALPLSLAVGQELLDEAGWTGPRQLHGVAADAPAADCLALGERLAGLAGRVAMLVLGDGSARRGLKAPGYLDERAAGYDGQARRGLAGDLAALRSLDAGLGQELLAAGRAPWQVLAGAAAGGPPPQPEVRYEGDPFGVYYLVVSWSFPAVAAR